MNKNNYTESLWLEYYNMLIQSNNSNMDSEMLVVIWQEKLNPKPTWKKQNTWSDHPEEKTHIVCDWLWCLEKKLLTFLPHTQ